MHKWILALSATLLWPVLGDAAEPDVKKLVDEAMFQDYLNLKFDEASLKLKQAADVCAESKCPEAALIQAHLGTVYFVGFEDEDRGRKYIAAALKADPEIQIDSQFSTPRLEKAWNAERKKLDGNKNGNDNGNSEDDDEPGPAEALADGDGSTMEVSAVPEQTVRTPVPVFVKLKDHMTPRSVVVRYRPFGGKSFKRVRLDRVRDGFGGEIPCLEVGSVTGKLAYYVEALDNEGNILAASGSADKPFKTDVVRSLRGDPPHLPGQAPPAQCIDRADCPPDFPGCAAMGGGGKCLSDGDCGKGKHCDDGACVSEDKDEGPQNWFSLEFQQDFMIFTGETGVCSGGNQYYCYYEGDVYYANVPYDGSGNEISGGVRVANQRLMVGYDRSLANMFTLGARLGYSFTGGPDTPEGKSFLPVYAELRFAYHFLENPFARTGFVPYVFLAGGVAESHSRIQVIVFDGPEAYQRDERLTLNAWREVGIGFGSLGVGTQIKITNWTGFNLDFRLTELFPALGTQFAGRAGYFAGF